MNENSIEEILNSVVMTDGESNRYASIRRVAIASRKTEETRHADALSAISAKEQYELSQLATAINHRVTEKAENHAR